MHEYAGKSTAYWRDVDKIGNSMTPVFGAFGDVSLHSVKTQILPGKCIARLK
jgi:hypothetical protein